MKKHLAMFPSRAAQRTFILLIAGFIVLVIASLFVYSGLRPFVWRQFNRNAHIYQIERVLTIANKVPDVALARIVRSKNSRVIYFRVSRRPYDSFQQLNFAQPAKVAALLYQKHKLTKFAVPIKTGRWLNVRIHLPPIRWWLFSGFIILALVVLFALIALCFWAIKYLATPLSDFSRAARRFGLDLNAPPIAEAGSEEMREVVHAFNQMQERIRKLINDRTQMLAAISHDLRTPITRLKLRAEYLEGTEQQEKILADLREIEDMVSSVLVFARNDAREESMERFDLEALVDSICEDMVNTGMEVLYQSSDERLPYFGRMNVIKRALVNLIENAVRYGKSACVQLSADKNFIHILIDDKGSGIPSDKLQKVFEPFYRVEHSRSRSTGGTGLGLVIARDAIRAHGGDIELKNLVKGGLRAEVILPINKGL